MEDLHLNTMNFEKYKTVIYGFDEKDGLKISDGCGTAQLSCALGCFDGVHMGHRALMEAARFNSFGYTPAVWTFSEPISRPFIETVKDRLLICGQLGIETAVCEDFRSVKEMTPEQFVRHLHFDVGVRHFICGSDFRFGINRTGDSDTLISIAGSLGDFVTVIPPLTSDDLSADIYGRDEAFKVSSSVIREMIALGDVESAAVLLGRRFGVTAEICDGKHIGRTMGLPTINQKLETGRVVPAFGVYYSVVHLNGTEYPAVTNIGMRPTVNDDENSVTCETHILNCNAELYGHTVKVELYKYARKEQKFSGLGALKSAIEGDIDGAKAFFGLKEKA